MRTGSYQHRHARGLILLAFVVAFLAATPKTGTATAESAPFQALLNPDGSGRLFVTNGTVPAWSVCAPDRSNCRPFATGGDITTAGAPAAVVFWAGDGWLSPIWDGNVVAVGAPSLSGTLRANELVTPIPGQWQGGWITDRDTMQMAACTTEAGDECITLTDRRYPAGCPGGAAVLDPVFAGKYLRVADRRFAADTTTTFEAVNSPYGQELWMPSPITSVAVVGRIGSSRGQRAAKCGPPPLVRATISGRGVARVRCGLGCRASLIARKGEKTRSATRSLRPFPLQAPRNYPIPELRLSSKSLAAFGSGPVSAVVLVDGKRAASRTLHLSGGETHRHRNPPLSARRRRGHGVVLGSRDRLVAITLTPPRSLLAGWPSFG